MPKCWQRDTWGGLYEERSEPVPCGTQVFPASSKVSHDRTQLSPSANMLVPLENVFKNRHLKMSNRQWVDGGWK